MSAFDEIEIKSNDVAAASEVPAKENLSETPATLPAETSTQTQEPQAETTASEGARPEEVHEQATEDEPLNLTGRETPEELQTRHGDSWAVKTSRRLLPLVEKAGSAQNLRFGAELISDITNPDTKGLDVIQKIGAFSKSRAQEIVDDIYWTTVREQPDMTLQGLLELPDVTLQEVKQAVETQRVWNKDQTVEPEDELSTLPPAVRKKLEDYDRLMGEVPELKKEVTSFKSNRESEEVTQLGQELYQQVFSVVDERKKKLGLESLPTDSDEVKDIKLDLQELLSAEKIEAAFEANKENMQLADRAISYVKKRDRTAAFSFHEPLALGAEMTFESMLRDPRISRRLASLKTVMESQSTPKDPTTRQEIVAGAAAGFSAPDPYDEGLKEGKSPFDVAVERAGTRAATT